MFFWWKGLCAAELHGRSLEYGVNVGDMLYCVTILRRGDRALMSLESSLYDVKRIPAQRTPLSTEHMNHESASGVCTNQWRMED